MKNKLTDLNDHLFAQLERLSDESLAGEALRDEIQRADSMTDVAAQIIANAKLVLDAHKTLSEAAVRRLPPMLGVDRQEP